MGSALSVVGTSRWRLKSADRHADFALTSPAVHRGCLLSRPSMRATDDPAAMPPLLKSGLLYLIFVALIINCAAPLSMWLTAPTSDTAPATPFPAPVPRTASVAVPTPSTPATT